MKKFLLPLLPLLFFACTGKKETDKDMLVGTWQPVEIGAMEMEAAEKKEILEKATIEFTKDGKYLSRFDGNDQDGTWTFDEATKKISTHPANGDNDEHFTVGWSADTLVFTNERNEIIKLKRKRGQ